MCTLIIGRDVVAPGSILLAANRDEDPGRPTDPPGVLSEVPRLVGGRDRQAGGTWLALRDGRAVVAILNRRDRSGGPSPPAPGRRSRGALVLDVASVAAEQGEGSSALGGSTSSADAPSAPTGPGLADAALRRAVSALRDGTYGPCTLVFATPEAGWLMALESDGTPRFEPLATGWHVLTHADLDDPDEPRTAWLVRELAGFAPRSAAEAEERLSALLSSHGDPVTGAPPVCLHQGRMTTVSASCVWLSADEARYRHAEGRPCEHPFVDHSHLLQARAPEEGQR